MLPAKIRSVKQHHRLLFLELSNQQKWLAKPIRNLEQMSWWESIDQELRQRGFQQMPKPMIHTNWAFMPYVKSRRANYQSTEDIQRIIPQLARFHLAGRCLETPKKSRESSVFYERLYIRLYRFHYLIKRINQFSEPYRVFFQTYGPLFYEDAYRVLQSVQHDLLRLLTANDIAAKAVCHRDLANHNWLIDLKQQAWLIDFDTADYDLQLGDVWQIASRILHEQNGLQQFERIIQMYQQVRPLTKQEMELLILLLGFPNDFFRESEGLLLNKKGYNIEATWSYLKRLADDRKQWKEQLKQLSDW
ncbi:phosphotransferase [Seinonella peptonophila]|uniref:phosphotransferase n=1 Tax=Seinonella peptonophila TaxID=112248 RepID=UPI0015876E1E|nr:phosphotransferase [Seinonella peptonophila]